MGRVWLIVVMSLWIATLGNLALWRELGNLPELQGPKGLSFKIAFGVGIAGVAAALLALFNWRHVFKPVLTILLVATALGLFDPALSKVGVLQPGGIGLPGEQLTWTITLTNTGTGTATNIPVVDTLPDALRITALRPAKAR